MRSVRSLGPLIKTRAFGMTPGRRFPNYFKPTDYPLAVVGFEVGEVCADYQDYAFRNLNSKRLQFDEMWSWIYCKEKNRTEEIARMNPDAGDVWLWVCVDADSKLVPSWRLGQRDLATAKDFVSDIAKRVRGRVQITTDALKTYLNVIEDAFGGDCDYAVLHKIYGAPTENETRYSPAKWIWRFSVVPPRGNSASHRSSRSCNANWTPSLPTSTNSLTNFIPQASSMPG